MDDGVGTKRRLPLWMSGVAAADQIRNSEVENRNVNHENIKEGSKVKPATKRIKKGISRGKEGTLESNSCLLVKCETRKRGRKLNQEEDGGSDVEIRETMAEKKRCNGGGRKFRKCARGKRGVAESLGMESSEEIETPSPGEDDGELTVDDLMSIAQEYIRTDERVEQQRPSDKEQEAERPLPPISLSGKESGGLPNAPQSNRRSPTHKEMMSVRNSTGTSAGGGTVVNPSRTGDPAQDMLDLLLGPLLKKPRGEENKIDLVKENMTFAFEIEKQRQNTIATEEFVPLTKKKSSLKDTVAMFLD